MTKLDRAWRSGRVRLVRVAVAVGLLVLAAWWVIPTHSWERRSPVVWTISDSHGVHRCDLWAIAFVVPAGILLLPTRRRGRRHREDPP
ncbi:MAG: hypothetical protein U0V73_07315 [Acidimicrobiia bacterium]